jgi:hypothetical protein
MKKNKEMVKQLKLIKINVFIHLLFYDHISYISLSMCLLLVLIQGSIIKLLF